MISNRNIRINADRCYTCGICVDRCIMDNLRLSTAPCRQACPLNLNCQGYIRLIVQGDEEAAARELNKYTPFGAILGHVCLRPCETACARNRKFKDGAVHIRALKRYLADTHPDIALSRPIETKPDSGYRTAIVGAGPAGLMAAYQLKKDGHQAVLFEAKDQPGESIFDSKHETRLPTAVMDQAVDYLESIGIEIKTGHTLGQDIDFKALEGYDAIIIAMGEPLDKGILPKDLIDSTTGRISANDLTHKVSSRKNFFACGTCLTGPSSVVHAMASGKEAAISTGRFLQGESLGYGRDSYIENGWIRTYDTSNRQRTGGSRVELSNETDQTLTPEQARIEAERCLSCGRPFDLNQTCWYCLPCEIECPVEALEVRMPYQVR